MNFIELCIGIYSLIVYNIKSGNDCEIDVDLEKKIVFVCVWEVFFVKLMDKVF